MKIDKKVVRCALSKKHQRGISNIQIMVGVLISAILILGGIGLIRYIDKAKVNNDLSELTELKARTVAYGSSHGGSFSGFTQELAVGLDFFPPNRVSGASGSRVVSNQWKGTVVATPIGIFLPFDSVVYTYTGIPSAACKELVLQATNLAVWISVNGLLAKRSDGFLDEPVVVSSCDMNGDNATVGYAMTK